MTHSNSPLSIEGRRRQRIVDELADLGFSINRRTARAADRAKTSRLAYTEPLGDEKGTTAVWNIHYNYHRPHSGAGGRPPASRLRAGVTNVRPSYN